MSVPAASAQSVPTRTHFQGRLTDASNNPLTGANSFVFGIYDAVTGGNLLWTETQPAVAVANGVFAVQLGAVTPLQSSVLSGSTAYLQVTVNGNVMTPREQLVAVPYAHSSEMLSGRSFSAFVSTDATTQNIAGAKTFTGTISVPTPTLPAHAVTKAYVDLAGGSSLLIASSTWSGQNTFLNMVSVSSDIHITGSINRNSTLSIGALSAAGVTAASGTFTASGATQHSVQTSSGILVGGTGGVYAAFFSGNGAGLTGVTATDASKVAKTGDTMSGDLQVGAAAASTISASGFMTLANLAVAPAAKAGRVYFDSTLGKLRYHSGVAFVDVSTGAGVSADAVAKAGDTMTGDLQVGGVSASTISASGFVTLANLGVAPAPSRGRVYFDPAGSGALRVSLDGASFVPISTGTSAGGLSSVAVDSNQMTGDGNSGNALTLKSSSVTLQGNAFNAPSKLVQLNAAGDLQVGGATASTISASGFVTMAGLAVAPAAQAGRFYFDSTTGKMRYHSGVAFVDISTGTGAGLATVSATAAEISGDGSAGLPLKLVSSSVTLQGNTFNASDKLVRLDSSTRLPAVDGSLVTSLSAANLTGTAPAGTLGNAVLKTGSVMTGDLTVGGATASTISASGFVTMAGLAVAPAAQAGRFYFDSTTGKMRYHSGVAFVDLSTGTPSAGTVSVTAAELSGDGSGGSPLKLQSSSVTLQGNTFNAANKLVQLNAAGDLQLGGAAASTFSAAGFVTLANLASAPGASRGRVYFDPSGSGALRVSLDGSSFVPISTGTSSGGLSNVAVDAAQFSGDGNSGNALTLKSSSVTLQGNSFNAANKLVQLDASGDLQVGGASASTISASGFVTLANLAVAPAAKAGRVYFDSTTGKLRFHSGVAFVDVSTGAGVSPDSVAKAGDTMTGDLQVGGATASTISASGFVTLAGLAAQPAAQAGRFYFDSTTGKMRYHSGVAYVDISTGTAGADSSKVAKAGDIMTGDLQIGGAAASTFSASGFLTMAGLPGQPAGANGRVYYDSTTGKLRLFTAGAFVDISTGSASASNVSLNSDQTFTGVNTFQKNLLLSTGTIASPSQLGVDAPPVVLRGQAWDGIGLASVNRQFSLKNQVTNDANWKFVIDRGGPVLFSIDQAGNVVATTSMTASAFFGDGGALTGLDATKVAQGTLGDARLPAVMSGKTLTGALTVAASTLTVTGMDAAGYSLSLSSGINMPAGTVTAAQFIGNGAGLTNITATNVAAANVLPGTFGAGVLINANSIAGFFQPAVLPSTVAYTNASNTFVSSQTVSAPLGFKVDYGIDAGSATFAIATIASMTATNASVLYNVSAGSATFAAGIQASSATFTQTGSTLYSLETSSGIKVNAGTISAPSITAAQAEIAQLSAPAIAIVTGTATGYGAVGHGMMILRSAKGTEAAPTASQANDTLGQIGWRGYGATGFASGERAAVAGLAAENWTDAAQGTHLALQTTPLGGVAAVERMRVDSEGNVGIGTDNPTAKLHIGGTAGIDGIRFPDGSLMTTAGVGSASAISNALDAVVNADSDGNSSGNMRLQTKGVDRLYITNGGAIGVGTISPTEALSIVGGARLDRTAGTRSLQHVNPDSPLDQSQFDSPSERFVGVYDSNAGGGAVTRSEYNADITHFMTAAGASPAGRLGVSIPEGSERLSVLSSGRVGVMDASPTNTLDVTGSIGVNDVTVVTAGRLLQTADGAAAAPAVSFANETNLGVYRPTSGALSVATAGTERARFDANGLAVTGIINASSDIQIGGTPIVTAGRLYRSADGAVAGPAFSFSAETNTGMYRPAANALSLGTAGTERGRFDVAGLLVTGNVNATGDFRINGTPVLTATRLYQAADGAVGGPGFSFSAETNTGMFRPSANVAAFATGGIERGRFNTAGLSVAGNTDSTGDYRIGGTVVLTSGRLSQTADGTAAAPAQSFATETNLGVFKPAAATLGFATGGIERFRTDSTGLNLLTGDYRVNGTSMLTSARLLQTADGLVSAPAMSFSAEATSGLFRPSASVVGVAVAGVERGRFDASGFIVSGNVNTTGDYRINGVPVLTAGRLYQAADGLVATPSLSFSAETNTGWYRPAAGSAMAASVVGTERGRFDTSGLSVTGNTNTSGDYRQSGTVFLTSTRLLQAADGAVGGPAISFANEATLGMYRPVAGSMAFGSGGTEITRISGSGLNMNSGDLLVAGVPLLTSARLVRPADGTVALPAVSFSAETNTGLYRPVASALAVTANGTERGRFDAAGLLVTGNVNTTGDFRINGTPVLTATRLYQAADGAIGGPGFSFSAETNTGMYRPGANALGFATLGVERGRFDVSGLAVTGGIATSGDISVNGTATVTSTRETRMANGTLAAPSHSFSAETNLGMYRAAAATLGVVTAGVERHRTSAAGLNLVTGDLLVSGTPVITSGRVMQTADGTVALPSKTFSSETNTGLFRPSASVLGITVAGVERGRFDTTGLTVSGIVNTNGDFRINNIPVMTASRLYQAADGLVSGPALSFSAEPTTGWFRPATGSAMAASVVGTERGRFTTSGLSVTGNTDTSGDYRQSGTVFLTAARLLQAADGAVAGPAISFASETSLGMYRPVAGSMAFGSGGTEIARISAAGMNMNSGDLLVAGTPLLTSARLVRPADGTVTIPAVSFSAETNTGLYRPVASALGITAGGAERGRFDAAGLLVTGNVNTTGDFRINGTPVLTAARLYQAADGAIGGPGFSFSAETNTGMYRPGANALGFATLGVERGRFDSTGLLVSGNTNTSGDYRVAGTVMLTTGRLGQAADGTIAAPAWSFASEPATGLFRPSASVLAMSVAGVERGRFDTSGLSVTGITNTTTDYRIGGTVVLTSGRLVQPADGTAAAPALSFATDTNMGLYRIGAATLGFATSGAERMRLTSGGLLGIGTTAPTTPLTVAGTGRFENTAGSVAQQAVNTATPADQSFLNSPVTRITGVYDSNAAVGVTRSEYDADLQMVMTAAGTPAGRLAVQVPAGSERMTILSSGQVGIADVTPTNTLDVAGTIGVGDTTVITAGRLHQAADGALATPGFTFASETNMGLYRPGAGALSLVTGGAERGRFDSTGLTVTGIVNATSDLQVGGVSVLTSGRLYRSADGTLAGPGFSFATETNSGIFRPAAGAVALSILGTERGRFDASGFNVTTGDLLVGGVSSLTSARLARLADGTAALPSYSFTNNVDMGMYRSAAATIGWSTAGVERLKLSAAGLDLVSGDLLVSGTPIATSARLLRAADGALTTPSLSFSAEANTGLYRPSAGVVSVVSAGTERARVDGSGLSVTGTMSSTSDINVAGVTTVTSGRLLRVADGAAATPSHGFGSETTLGMYRVGAATLGFATSSAERMRIDSAGRVGIGATSLVQPLHVVGAGRFEAAAGALTHHSVNTATPADQSFLNSPITRITGVYDSNPAGAAVTRAEYDGEIQMTMTGAGAVPAGRMAFNVGTGAERMSLTSLGRLGIGVTNPQGALDVNSTIAVNGSTIVTAGRLVWTADGAAATPAHTFTSDQNMGLYRAGAGILATATSGIERMRVDAAGLVGIGQATPTNLIHARMNDAANTSVTQVMRLEHTSSGVPANGMGTGIAFSGESSTTENRDMAQIDSLWENVTDAARGAGIRFQTVMNAGALTERVRISSAGFVGIGTTAPNPESIITFNPSVTVGPQGVNNASALELQGNVTSDNPIAIVAARNTAIGGVVTRVAQIEMRREGANDAGNILLHTRAAAGALTERVRILSGGNVGIGLAAPTAKLHVGGTPGVDGIRFPDGTLQTTAGVGSANGVSNNTDVTSNADSDANGSGSLRLQTAGTDRVFIQNDGIMGIGTTAPNFLIDAQSNAITSAAVSGYGPGSYGTAVLRSARGTKTVPTTTQSDDTLGALGFRGFGATVFPTADRAAITGSAAEVWTDSAQGTYLALKTTPAGTVATAERMRIDDAGDVGIGVTNPTAKLHIGGTPGVDGIRFPDGTLQTSAGVGSVGGVSNIVDVAINADSDASAGGALRLQTQGVDRLVVNNDGNVAIGTGTAVFLLDVQGAGVSSAAITGFGAAAYGSTVLRSARGTQALPTASALDDALGQVGFRGYGATSFAASDRASMAAAAAEGWTDGAQGAYLTLNTTPAGTIVPAERVRIADSGNVGIGVTDPTAKLHVGGTAGVDGIRFPDGTLLTSASGLAAVSAVGVGSTTDAILNADSDANLSGALRLQTGGADRVYVQNDGLVGFGVNAPLFGIDVQSVGIASVAATGFGAGAYGNAVLRSARGTQGAPSASVLDDVLGQVGFRGYGATGFAASGRAAMAGNAAETWTNTAQGAYLTFDTTPTGSLVPAERVRITDSGNVGIGIAVPTAKLHVAGTAGVDGIRLPDGTLLTSASGLAAGSMTSTGDAIINADSDADNNGDLRFQTKGTDRMRLTNGGRLGVGVASPSEPLHVLGAGRFDRSADAIALTSVNPDIPANNSQLNSPVQRFVGVYDSDAAGGTTRAEYNADVQFNMTAAGASPAGRYSVSVPSGNERLSILSNGKVGIGQSNPANTLDVGGSIGVGNTTVVTAGRLVQAADGAAATPAVGFASETNLGLFRPVSGAMAVATAGTERARFDASGLTVTGTISASSDIQLGGVSIVTAGRLYRAGDGLVGGPAFSFSAETNTGMYRPTAQALGLATNGTERVRLDGTGISVTGNTNTSGDFRIGNTVVVTSGRLLQSADGTVSAPGQGFASETNTGMYRPSAGVTAFSTLGTERARLDVTGLSVTGLVNATADYRLGGTVIVTPASLARMGDGTAAAPGYSFNSETNLGFYRPAAGIVAMATGGIERLRVDSTGLNVQTGDYAVQGTPVVTSARLVRSADGAVATPGHAFASEVNTGMFRPSASVLALSVAGTERGRFDTSGLNVTGLVNMSSDLQIGGVAAMTSLRVVRSTDGVVGAPGMSFGSETNTGLFRSAAGAIGFATLGTERARMDASGLSVQGNYNTTGGGDYRVGGTVMLTSGRLAQTADGAVAGPSFSFASETNLGMYRPVAGAMAFGSGGTEIARINASGMNIATGDLQVAGTSLLTSARLVRPADGAVGTPAFSFASETNTGLYRPVASALAVTAAGVERGRFSASGLLVTGNVDTTGDFRINGTPVLTATRLYQAADGALATPSYTFSSETNTGLFRPGATVLGFSVTGTERGRFDTSGLLVTGNTNTTGEYRVGGTTVLTSGRLAQTADGAVATPGHAFASEPNMGLYRPGAAAMGFVTAGVERFRTNTTGLDLLMGDYSVQGTPILTSARLVRSADGAVATPGHAFASEVNTGMFRPSAGVVAFSAAGTERGRFDASGLNVTGLLNLSSEIQIGGVTAMTSTRVLRSTDGVVGAPGMSFGFETNTGLFRPVAGALGFATLGVERARMDASGLSVAGIYNATGGGDYRIGGTVMLTSGRLAQTADGAVGGTAFGFASETNLGMYRPVAGSLAFGASGTEIARINSSGMNIASGDLQVAGTSLLTSGRLVRPADGLVGTPAFSFSAETNTGLYRPVASALAVTAAGVERARFSAAGLLVTGNVDTTGDFRVNGVPVLTATRLYQAADGALAGPSYTFASETNTGLYRPGAAVLGFSVTGTERGRFDTSGLLVTGNTNTTGELQIGGTSLVTSGRILRTADGAVATPGHSFASETNTGLFRPSASVLAMSVAGVERGRFNTSGLSVTGNTDSTGDYRIGGTVFATSARLLQAADGTAAAPGISFNSDTDGGMFRVTTDVIGFATAGSERMRLDASGRLGIGTTSPSTTLMVAGTGLRVEGAQNAVLMTNANSATPAEESQQNSPILRMTGVYDSTVGAGITRAEHNADFQYSMLTAGASPTGRLGFSVPAGTERLSVLSTNGNVGIGDTTPTNVLDVNGTIGVGDVTVITAARLIRSADGAVAGPGFSFGSETNTGLFRPGASIMGVSIAGTERARFDVNGMLVTGNVNATGEFQISGTQLVTAGRLVRTADGAAGAPALSFGSDQDVGMFRPAADALAFATAGTERARVDNTGLSVTGTINATGDILSGGVVVLGSNRLYRANDGAVGGPAFSFTSETTLGMYRPAASTLGLVTNGVERMRLDSAGNMGLGTSSPGSTLHVRVNDATNAANTNVLRLEHDTTGTPGAGLATGIAFAGETSASENRDMGQIDSVWTNSTDASRSAAMRFQTVTSAGALTERVRITDTGFMGVNTISPARRMHVAETGAGFQQVITLENTNAAAADMGPQLDWRGTGVDQAAMRAGWNGAATTDAYLAFLTRGSNSPSERMRITSAGNVGIGVTNPAVALAVGGATGSTHESNRTDSQAQVYGRGFAFATDSQAHQGAVSAGLSISVNRADPAAVLSNATGDLLRLHSGATERLRIVNTGNMGLGTTSPNVSGETANSRVITISGVSAGTSDMGALELRNPTATAGFTAGNLSYIIGNTRVASITGVSHGSAADTGELILNTKPTGGALAERVRIDRTGNVGIGVAAPAAKLQVTGGDMYTSTAGNGLILKSPDGTVCRRVGIDNTGAMTLSVLACP